MKYKILLIQVSPKRMGNDVQKVIIYVRPLNTRIQIYAS